ncbi:plasmid mobilization protein [Xinfangfangia pollutisoli]|uniref:plasmid mobilization protein n=1 Tax=Xinfangfangia pollutisoli TaxID=2865960 RepID=UPI001CD7A24D|nr:plasmid mobilization relaxosome protein MobC [Xinfangfangia pollutisoli]
MFRCTAAEKAELRQKAEAAGVPVATLLREALGRTDARRRKPAPRVDPALVLAVGRIGGNLNQIARWLNRAHAAGLAPTIDAVEVARRLLSVERQLAQLLAQGREC